MPATLGTNLVDSLVGVVDSLKADLYPAMGVRQFKVEIVKRSWSGEEIGDGAATITQELLISPPPLVTFEDGTAEDRADRLEGAGRMEVGEAVLTEVSLTLTEAELEGRPLPAKTETYYRISDVQGQGIAPTYWVIAKPPKADREKDIGWVVRLRRFDAVIGPNGADHA